MRQREPDVADRGSGGWRRPFVVAGVLWLGAIFLLGFALITVTNRVREGTGDFETGFDFVGIPLLVGFRHSGRIGTHVEWGVLLLLVGPFIVGMLLVLRKIAAMRRASL